MNTIPLKQMVLSKGNAFLSIQQQCISTVTKQLYSSKTLPTALRSTTPSLPSTTFRLKSTNPQFPSTRPFTTSLPSSHPHPRPLLPISTRLPRHPRHHNQTPPPSRSLPTRRNMSTNAKESPPTPLLPPPNAAQAQAMAPSSPSLEKISFKDGFLTTRNFVWKWGKRAVLTYLVVGVLSATVVAYFAPFVRHMVFNRTIADLHLWGNQSQWYFPIMRQNAEYPLTWDPQLPSLNFYRLKIFILKELEASYRAGTAVYDHGETLRANAQLRVVLLKSVLNRGWAYGGELSSIMYGSTVLLRRDQTQNSIDGGWKLDPKIGATEYAPEDRVELNRVQIEYIKTALKEFQQLEAIGLKLYALGNEIKSSSIASMWKMGFNNSDLRLEYDPMREKTNPNAQYNPSSHFHRMASVAAATAKLSDALYSLTSSNVEQILSYMQHFDTKIAELANYGPHDNMPKVPKLSFEVPSERQFTAQISVLQDKLRKVHDPEYDPKNPVEILDDAGIPIPVTSPHTNPDGSPNPLGHSLINRSYLPYVSPARPYPLVAPMAIQALQQKFPLDPTYQQEVDAAVSLSAVKYYDTWSSFYADLSDAIFKYRSDELLKEGKKTQLQEQLKEAEQRTEEWAKAAPRK